LYRSLFHDLLTDSLKYDCDDFLKIAIEGWEVLRIYKAVDSASRAVVSGWACSALVNEREGSGRGFHVVGAELLDAKSAQFNQVVNLSVEMATAAERFPRWS
jgi:hypothetical protein